jgi:hypothetical protein
LLLFYKGDEVARRLALLVLLPCISASLIMGAGGRLAEWTVLNVGGLGTSRAEAATAPPAKEVEELSKRVGKLTSKLEKLESLEYPILAPIAVLVGVLALGGGLGIVFSIRDQRRISQMHELTVAGEVSSQRRTEQSYGSFLEQSQTTISLVNDTLRLAQEASEREARGIENKAKARTAEIEERAEALMLGLFSSEDFERLLDNQDARHELEQIGKELGGLEGSLDFQEVDIQPYTKFVRAMNRFIHDETEMAIRELQRANHDRQPEELHRFSLYWLGYMLTTVSQYEDAIRAFKRDEIGLPKEDVERLQLERMIAETEFFKRARLAPGADGKPTAETRSPRERFEEVAPILATLSVLAAQARKLEESALDDGDAKIHTCLEIAQTRADLYSWIAYDPNRLDSPLEVDPPHTKPAMPEIALEQLAEDSEQLELRQVEAIAAFKATDDWKKLDQPDHFRAWALSQAQAICEDQRKHHKLNFYVAFALAECYFMLKDSAAQEAFKEAERLLVEEHGDERERRTKATLEQGVVICHSRLLFLRQKDEVQARTEIQLIMRAVLQARQAVNDMGRGNTTVFSLIQRRNLSREDFTKELHDILAEEGLEDAEGEGNA